MAHALRWPCLRMADDTEVKITMLITLGCGLKFQNEGWLTV